MYNEKNHMVFAIVMGLTETGLSIARALGRRGIPVVGTNPDRLPPTYSRFLSFVKEPHFENEDQRVDFYVRLGKTFKSQAILFPTGDQNVLFISRNRTVLGEHFLFHVPSHKLLESIASKRRIIRKSEELGLPLPPAILPNGRDSIADVPSTMFPCLIKPEFTCLWGTEESYAMGIGGLKAIPAMSRSELLGLYDRVIKVDSRVIIQKMVLGPDENHLDYHALVQPDGKIRGEFVGRKLRLTPPHFGMGCYVESIKSDEVVNEGRRIISLLRFTGMANINFKRDERDGRLYFLELNPRFSFWTGLDVACGMDFPYYYLKTCLGEPFEVGEEYKVGKRWLNLLRDVKGLRVYLRDESLSLKQWTGSMLHPFTEAIFALDDPMPALVLFFRFFKNAVTKYATNPERSHLEANHF